MVVEALRFTFTSPVPPAAKVLSVQRTTPSVPRTPPPSAETKLAPTGTGRLNCEPESVLAPAL